jgi:hypothetical protein
MSRVVVTQEDLRRALLVWLTVMPKYVWRRYEAYERKVAEKRQDEDDEPKAREAIAEYLAGKFAQASWDVTHPMTKSHGG